MFKLPKIPNAPVVQAIAVQVNPPVVVGGQQEPAQAAALQEPEVIFACHVSGYFVWFFT